MLGSGRMWVAQAALNDPRAVKMSMQGQGLPTEALLKRYLPPVSAYCRQLAGTFLHAEITMKLGA